MTIRQKEIVKELRKIKISNTEQMMRQEELNLPATGEEVLQVMKAIDFILDISLELSNENE